MHQEAASLLRYYSEYIFKEICHNLKASLEFRGDGRYELGDLMTPAVSRFRSLLKDGILAAESWGKQDEAAVLKELDKKILDCLKPTNADQWLINPAIHYNEWANFNVPDFEPVALAFKNLIKQFSCSEEPCKSLFYLTMTPPRNMDTVRCNCGDTNINLKKKKAVSA